MSSIFIEDGLITFTKGRTKPKREFEAEGDAISKDIPVVVLVDRGSASASEIVTGALRDTSAPRWWHPHVRQGRVPGGAAAVQRRLLDITVGEYFLPSGENIGKKGVRPTVRAVDNPDTDRDEALPIALKTLPRRPADPPR